jgi:hypothetical protein
MRGSLVALLLASGVAVLVLLLGLAEARHRQRKADEIEELAGRLAVLEERLGRAKAAPRSGTEKGTVPTRRVAEKLDRALKKLEELERRVRQLETRPRD